MGSFRWLSKTRVPAKWHGTTRLKSETQVSQNQATGVQLLRVQAGSHAHAALAAAIAATMSLNSGLSEAPPTRKPSISGCAESAAAFAALAEPPYWIRMAPATSADGPDRLIGDDHLCRVEHLIDLRELHVHLREDSFEAPLADLLGLPDAEDARHARGEDVFELCRQRLVGVHWKNAELPAALRVSDQHLRDAHVLHLLYRHLAREGATAPEVAVLGSDLSTVREL